jgi:hypothetical protein
MEEGEGSSRREEPPAAAPAPRFTVKTELSDTTASDLALRLVRHRQRAVEFLGAMADSKEAAEQAAGPARHHLTSALIIACAALQRARITADIASKSDELVDEASGADDAAAAAPEPSSRESPALQTLDGVRPPAGGARSGAHGLQARVRFGPRANALLRMWRDRPCMPRGRHGQLGDFLLRAMLASL